MKLKIYASGLRAPIPVSGKVLTVEDFNKTASAVDRKVCRLFAGGDDGRACVAGATAMRNLISGPFAPISIPQSPEGIKVLAKKGREFACTSGAGVLFPDICELAIQRVKDRLLRIVRKKQRARAKGGRR